MQDALPALVLNSEALPRHAMDETPSSQPNPQGAPVFSHTGISDERLMLAFRRVLRRRLRNSSPGTSSPSTGFFAAASPNPPTRRNSPRRRFSLCCAPRLATSRVLSFARISTPSASRFCARIAAKLPFAPLSWASAIRFLIAQNKTLRNRAFGSAALLKNLSRSTAKSSCCANSSN